MCWSSILLECGARTRTLLGGGVQVRRSTWSNLWYQTVRKEFILQPGGIWRNREKESYGWEKDEVNCIVIACIFSICVFCITKVAAGSREQSIKAGLCGCETARFLRMLAEECYVLAVSNHPIGQVKGPALNPTNNHSAALCRDWTVSWIVVRQVGRKNIYIYIYNKE